MNKLKELRKNAGYTALQFAMMTGIPLSTIHAYEQGKRSLRGCKLDRLFKMAEALNMDFNTFITYVSK